MNVAISNHEFGARFVLTISLGRLVLLSIRLVGVRANLAGKLRMLPLHVGDSWPALHGDRYPSHFDQKRYRPRIAKDLLLQRATLQHVSKRILGMTLDLRTLCMVHPTIYQDFKPGGP